MQHAGRLITLPLFHPVWQPTIADCSSMCVLRNYLLQTIVVKLPIALSAPFLLLCEHALNATCSILILCRVIFEWSHLTVCVCPHLTAHHQLHVQYSTVALVRAEYAAYKAPVHHMFINYTAIDTALGTCRSGMLAAVWQSTSRDPA